MVRQEEIINPGLQEKLLEFKNKYYRKKFSFCWGNEGPAELKTNMICSALTTSEPVLWIWNWLEESLTIKAETWKCKQNCFKDIWAADSLIWSVFNCTVILPTHHNHNLNREPGSIDMEIFKGPVFHLGELPRHEKNMTVCIALIKIKTNCPKLGVSRGTLEQISFTKYKLC